MTKPDIEGYIFDLDGTVYLGEKLLPGARACIAELRRRGKRLLFVSNNPLKPRHVYAGKLERLGIAAGADDVLTSGYVLGRYLAATLPQLSLYVIGEAPLIEELRGHGLAVIAPSRQDPKQIINPEGIDAVIVAFDRELDYLKLNTAYQALSKGARFFATNSDKACPLPGGSIPDAGATIAALEHITGRKVELLAGKPSGLMVEMALQKLGLPPERCMMVGDRLETDILMGQTAGMCTAVTLTGVTQRHDLAGLEQPPDFVIERLDELLTLTEQ